MKKITLKFPYGCFDGSSNWAEQLKQEPRIVSELMLLNTLFEMQKSFVATLVKLNVDESKRLKMHFTPNELEEIKARELETYKLGVVENITEKNLPFWDKEERREEFVDIFKPVYVLGRQDHVLVYFEIQDAME